jgi:hypothetical protein
MTELLTEGVRPTADGNAIVSRHFGLNDISVTIF